MTFMPRHAAIVFLLASAALAAQQPSAVPLPADQPHPTTAAEAPNRDTSYIDAQGTAHVTRVVPVPQTISPQAQQFAGPSRTGPGAARVAGRPPQA